MCLGNACEDHDLRGCFRGICVAFTIPVATSVVTILSLSASGVWHMLLQIKNLRTATSDCFPGDRHLLNSSATALVPRHIELATLLAQPKGSRAGTRCEQDRAARCRTIATCTRRTAPRGAKCRRGSEVGQYYDEGLLGLVQVA